MYNPGGISTAKELTKKRVLFMICYVLKNSEFDKIGSEENP